MHLSRLVTRRSVSLMVVLGMLAGLAVAAMSAEGYVQPEPELHDAGVWVTRTSEQRLGRTNTEIDVVDTSLSLGSGLFDVLQDGASVFVRQQEPSVLLGVDPASAVVIPGPELAPEAEVALGGGTGAVLDPAAGELHVVAAANLLGVAPSAADSDDGEGSDDGEAGDDAGAPTATVSGPAALTVGLDGIAHLVDGSDGTVRSFGADGAALDTASPITAGSLEMPAVTAVGSVPVVLDEASALVHLPGLEPVDVGVVGDGPRLQQAGPAAPHVLVAGDTALVRVDLTTGEVTPVITDGAGVPTHPVHLGGCDHVAWGGNGRVVRACGDDQLQAGLFEQFAGTTQLAWRVNRGRIVLNEMVTGAQLVYGDGEPRYLDDWSEALEDQPDDAEEEVDDDTPTEVQQEIDRTTNEPPIANDDVAGTRSGRPVVVRPLLNDEDPDGDVLVIEPIEPIDPDVGRVEVIEGGRAVLVELNGDQQRIRFGYTISDGHGHTASATVTVSLVGPEANNPPLPAVGERTTVVTGGTVTHDLLANATDPDGDPVSVLGATTEDGEVAFEASGQLAFTATNAPGTATVTYVLTDDRGGEAAGTLTVEVVPREANEPPVARSDYASTLVDREVVVDVLANDTDANGDDLQVVRVDDLTAANVRWDPTSTEIRVTSPTAGTVNLIYRITDGRDTDEGRVRIDVAEPGSQFPPVAVRDDVRLSAGRPVFVPVLDNDVDRDGEVLVVTGVQLPADSPLDVSVMNRSLVRVSTDRPLEGVAEFDYAVTDGTNVAFGRVVVAPAPVRARNQPPVVGPDEFTVRAGGIAVLPVLGNDSDPDGDRLELLPPEEVDDAEAAENGRLFLSEGQLRYEAPLTPKSSVILRTSVVDTAENVASGQLLVHVIAADGSRNTPPVAPTLTGRVLAGGRVAIPVPLTTMDPEGDAVQLLGVGEPPRLGAVVEVRADELVYDADASAAGTDQFTYRVRDQFGLEATGTVLIGVARAATANSAPVAGDDLANVVPGSTVTVPALANDSDPDGDPIALSTEDDDAPVAALGEAALVEGQLRYTAPADPVTDSTSFSYVVADGRGGRDRGTVTVNFVDELPNRPPVPIDDLIEPQTPGTLFSTGDLTANDTDPDGDELMVLSVSAPDATVDGDGSVSLTMTDGPLQFTYLITDGTEQRRAAVVVPVKGDQPPIARPDEATVEMLGETTIDVLANDSDPEGAELVLLDVVGVRNGAVDINGDQVTFRATRDEFVGDAGFAYRVADSTDPETQNVSLGVVQVTIDGTLNTAPQFTELRLEVPQDASRTLDLVGGVVDPDQARMGQSIAFSDLAGEGEGLQLGLEGSVLTVDASIDAVPGTTIPVTFTVDDGTDSVQGTVQVDIISSDKQLATVVADTAETVQGQPVVVDVLANDVNPFPETPLVVTEVTSAGGVTATTDGQEVTLTPDPDRRDIGEVQLEYTVADATGDPAREVTGTVAVTVIGRPDVPAAPTCIGGESGLVQIGWAAPSANGARITDYVVRIREFPAGEGGTPRVFERTYGGGATVQSVVDLTNGLDHTFAVAAINEAVVGEPEFSAPSPKCKPDQVPDRPEPPLSEFGDGELYLTFAAPPVDGSPITELTLTNTTTGESVAVGPAQTEYTWAGLENGTSYRFTLVATNERGDSDPSAPSTGDGIPAGAPLNPVAPTTEKGDRFLTVKWERPDENGDAVVEYRIIVIRAGDEVAQVSIPDGNRFSTQIDTDNGVDYEFQMQARNKAGWSDRSPRSAVAVSAGKPFAPGDVTASEGDTQSVLTFADADDNGATIDRYEVSINGTEWQTLDDDRTVRGLTNGTDYSFRVRAVNSEGAGPASPTSNTVNPYGKPTTPTELSGSHNNSKTITWTWNASSGNGRNITGYQVSVNGGSWRSPNDGVRRHKVTVNNWGDSASLRVRAMSDGADNARNTSAATGPVTVKTPGPYIVAEFTGTYKPCDSNPAATCQEVETHIRRFKKNTTITLRCYHQASGGAYGEHTITTDSNGAGGLIWCHVGANLDFWIRSVSPDVKSNTIRWN